MVDRPLRRAITNGSTFALYRAWDCSGSGARTPRVPLESPPSGVRLTLEAEPRRKHGRAVRNTQNHPKVSCVPNETQEGAWEAPRRFPVTDAKQRPGPPTAAPCFLPAAPNSLVQKFDENVFASRKFASCFHPQKRVCPAQTKERVRFLPPDDAKLSIFNPTSKIMRPPIVIR